MLVNVEWFVGAAMLDQISLPTSVRRLLAIAMVTHFTMAALVARPALAEDKAWDVSGDFFGEQKKLKPGDFKPSEDMSGIACDTAKQPWLCIAVDDETQGAQIVLVSEGKVVPGAFIRLIGDVFRNKPLELDAEAVAFGNGAFYVAGSHGRPRHEKGEGHDDAWIDARVRAASHLFRITFPEGSVDMSTGQLVDDKTGFPEVVESQSLVEAFGADADLAASMSVPLDQGGLTIEGLATDGTSLFVGLRGPTIKDEAVIVSVPIQALFGDAEMNPEIIRVALGTNTRGAVRGVRDLIALDDQLLILAGRAIDPDKKDQVEKGDYAIYSLQGAKVEKLTDLARYGDHFRPEGLLLLGPPGEQPTRLMLLFDGAPNGQPTLLELH